MAVVSAPATALETDQYYAWGVPLADSTAAVNARFNLELERAIAGFPEHRPPETCREIAAAYRSRLRFLLLHDIQMWAWNSQLVDRIPDGGGAWREYNRTHLYSRNPRYDPATWMPYTPTIEIAGVRIGTDKLAHMVSSGWTYYGEYRRKLKRGLAPEQAEREAIERGILEESLILGELASGVLSVADLEASHAGLHLYIDLCDADDPVLRLEEGGWAIARLIDLRDYVTPRWDESYQPSIYTGRRWKTLRPVLESYCDRLDDPQVIEMRRRYRDRDTGSLVADLVAERIADGKLPDPSQFGIEAVCDNPDPSRDVAPLPAGRSEGVSPTSEQAVLRQQIIDEETDRRRFALGLPGIRISYPLVASASMAVMATSQPASYDCTTPCDFRGFFAEAEPGLGGGKLSLGWARVAGVTNRSGSLLKAGYIGLAYRLSVLRTWGDHGWVEGGRTYAGFEFTVPVAQANVGLGLMYRVDAGDRGRWLLTGGAGWGF